MNIIGQAKRIIELKNSFENISSEFSRDSITPIFTFTSGKGGTGKTFLCLNIAYQLSLLGKKVLVVDMDLNFSNLHIMLNVIPPKTLYEFFASESTLDELIYDYNPNLHFIFGFSGFEPKQISINNIRYFYNQLSQISDKYDYIIIDTSSGGNDETLEILSLSDYNIVVANPEPTATLDAYAIIKLMTVSKKNNAIRVIINKYFNEEDAQYAFRNLTTAVGHFLKKDILLLASIPFDQNIVQAIMLQELYMVKYSHEDNHISELLLSIADELINIKQVANNSQR